MLTILAEINPLIAIGICTAVSIVVVTPVIFLLRYLDRRRSAALSEAARRLGLGFRATEDGEEVRASLRRFQLPLRGHSLRVRNIMSGEWRGRQVHCFDFRYVTGRQGKASSSHQTVAHLTVNRQLCSFILVPERLLSFIGEALGNQDIDFHTHPEFDRRFQLRGDDEEGIRALFSPTVLEFFEARPGTSVELVGMDLLYFRSGKRVKPEALGGFLDDAAAVQEILEG